MPFSLYPPLFAGLTTPSHYSPIPPCPRDDHLTFPPVRIPTILPHLEDLLVSLIKDENTESFPITTPLTAETIPNTTKAWAVFVTGLENTRQL
jgi:hypothetical protein